MTLSHSFLNSAGEAALKFTLNSNEYGNLFGIMTWIRFLFPETSSYRQCRDSSLSLYNFMKSICDQQFKTYQEGHTRSFMDVYIKEIKDAEEKDDQSGFLYDQLVMSCVDFLLPAITVLQTQVSFLLRFLLYNDKVMKKIQDEIESVVGSGRLPELDDRVK